MVKIQFSTLRVDIILTKFNIRYFDISTDTIISSLELFGHVLNGSQLPTSTKISRIFGHFLERKNKKIVPYYKLKEFI